MLQKTAIETARLQLAAILDPIKSEGARLTLSPVLQGPISKGEVQIFYSGSLVSQPQQPRFNTPFKQVRTVRWRVNILLKDLRQPANASTLLQSVRGLCTGAALFGEQEPPALYEGATYPGEDSFTKLGGEGFYFYTLLLQNQVVEALPMPGSVTAPGP